MNEHHQFNQEIERVARLMEQIHQIASDGWGTSGEAAALMRIAELTTPMAEQLVRKMEAPK